MKHKRCHMNHTFFRNSNKNKEYIKNTKNLAINIIFLKKKNIYSILRKKEEKDIYL